MACWIEGEYADKKPVPSLFEELRSYEGALSKAEAGVWLAKYCQLSYYFLIRLLTGVKLAPVQEILLRTWFQKDENLIVAGRGFSKSFTVSLFIILYAVLNPGVKIGICSGTFRQSKLIMKTIEDLADQPSGKGIFLQDCITQRITRQVDAWEMKIGASSIKALPLGKIRGYRFNVVIVDELLQVPTEIVETIIRPFLTVKMNGMEQEELDEAEEKLIKAGIITEDDKLDLYKNNKIIGLSSASYKFDSLYKDFYVPYVSSILSKEKPKVTHSVFRLSYRAAPSWLLDLNLIEDAKKKNSEGVFNREYEAIFTDDSGGYYSAKKVTEAVLAPTEEPKIKLKGDLDKKYILAIDPNFKDADTSDHFAMAVLELDEENESGTLVHAYAMSASNIKERAIYLNYLLNYFNIVYVIVDNAGGPTFIQSCNEIDALYKKISVFEEFFLDDDREKGLALTKENYRPGEGKIVHSQVFASYWIRLANEHLQGLIERKKIRFGAKIIEENDYDVALNTKIPIEALVFSDSMIDYSILSTADKQNDFIDYLNGMIDLTVKELILIECTTNSSGHQQFDLPKLMKADKSPTRARKDSYTVLLLAAWGMKCYFDLHKLEEPKYEVFLPRFIGGRNNY